MTNKKAIQTAIAADAYDTFKFEGVKEHAGIADLCATNEGLVQDVFNSFYKSNPTIKEGAPQPQASMMKSLMDMADYKALHGSTRLNDINSAFGALRFAPELVGQSEKAKEAQQQAQKSGKKSDGTPVPGPGQGAGDLSDFLTEEEQSEFRTAVRKAAEKAQDDAEQWSDVAKGFGIGSGDLEKLPFDEKFRLAENMMKSRGLKRIADLAGKFKNVVDAEVSTTYTHGFDEIVDVTTGSDIHRVLPVEILKLKTNPAQFCIDYLNGNLLQYDQKGVEELGKGPVVVCVDDSDSMRGEPESWAKGVALSLMTLCDKQKRDFGYISFESRVNLERFFPKQKGITLQDKIEIASHRYGGGTDFYAPLKAALTMIKKTEGLKPADIVFITDGEAHLSDSQVKEILDLKKETGARVYAIGIQVYSTETLELFSDQIAKLDDVGDISVVKNLIKSTASDPVKK